MAYILREKELVAELSISRSSIRRMIERGEFPEPISLGGRKIGWRRSDIEEWVATRENVAIRP